MLPRDQRVFSRLHTRGPRTTSAQLPTMAASLGAPQPMASGETALVVGPPAPSRIAAAAQMPCCWTGQRMPAHCKRCRPASSARRFRRWDPIRGRTEPKKCAGLTHTILSWRGAPVKGSQMDGKELTRSRACMRCSRGRGATPICSSGKRRRMELTTPRAISTAPVLSPTQSTIFGNRENVRAMARPGNGWMNRRIMLGSACKQ